MDRRTEAEAEGRHLQYQEHTRGSNAGADVRGDEGTPTAPGTEDLPGKFYKSRTGAVTSILQNISQKTEDEGGSLTSFMRPP